MCPFTETAADALIEKALASFPYYIGYFLLDFLEQAHDFFGGVKGRGVWAFFGFPSLHTIIAGEDGQWGRSKVKQTEMHVLARQW